METRNRVLRRVDGVKSVCLCGLSVVLFASSVASGAITISSNTVIDYVVPAGDGAVNVINGPSSPTVVDFLDGGWMAADVGVYGMSIYNHRGGRTEGEIAAFDMSTVNLFGGSVTEGEHIVGGDEGTINMYGGEIGAGIEGYGNARINIFGKGASYVGIRDFATVTVYGTSFQYDTQTNHVRGVFFDGSPMDIDIHIEDSARVILVPEPAVGVMTALGCGLLFWQRRIVL